MLGIFLPSIQSSLTCFFSMTLVMCACSAELSDEKSMTQDKACSFGENKREREQRVNPRFENLPTSEVGSKLCCLRANATIRTSAPPQIW